MTEQHYVFLSKEIPFVHGGGAHVEMLTWHEITPLTQDEKLRSCMPGRYARGLGYTFVVRGAPR